MVGVKPRRDRITVPEKASRRRGGFYEAKIILLSCAFGWRAATRAYRYSAGAGPKQVASSSGAKQVASSSRANRTTGGSRSKRAASAYPRRSVGVCERQFLRCGRCSYRARNDGLLAKRGSSTAYRNR